MSSMQKISIYSTKFCRNCKMLKQLLEQENLQYKDIDMATPAGLTELQMNDIFTMSAPVLQIWQTAKCCHNKFYTTKELCEQDIIDQDKVRILLKENIWQMI